MPIYLGDEIIAQGDGLGEVRYNQNNASGNTLKLPELSNESDMLTINITNEDKKILIKPKNFPMEMVHGYFHMKS